MMNCEWVQDNLSAYIDGELNLTQRQTIEAHLSKCNDCKDKFEILFRTWDSLSLWEDKNPPLNLKSKILNTIRKEKFLRLARILLPVAAVFIFILSTFLFYGNNFDKKKLLTERMQDQSIIKKENIKMEEDEIVKELQLIEEKEFYESVEMLKTIDYLPLIEDTIDNNKTSMGYYTA